MGAGKMTVGMLPVICSDRVEQAPPAWPRGCTKPGVEALLLTSSTFPSAYPSRAMATVSARARFREEPVASARACMSARL